MSQQTPPFQSSTIWAFIHAAKGEGEQARLALLDLLNRYRPTIVLLYRGYSLPPGDTHEDLAHGLVLGFLERFERGKNDFDRVDENKGTFGSWLRGVVRNDVRHAWRRHNRVSNADRVTVSAPERDLTAGDTPETLFLWQFALDTVHYAIEQLRPPASDIDKSRVFAELERFLPGGKLDVASVPQVAAELHIPATTLYDRLHKLHQSFKRELSRATADTMELDLADPKAKKAIEQEVALLYRALAEAPPRVPCFVSSADDAQQ